MTGAVILVDLNEQLPGAVKGLTGKWVHGKKSQNADKILDIMRMFNLFAASTNFQPKKNGTLGTYIHSIDGSFVPKMGQFVGKKVKAWYKGKLVYGKVTKQKTSPTGKQWIIEFEDGYKTHANETKVRRWLIPAKHVFKQIDHVLVSQRWKSSITNCFTDWNPSIHRSKWSIKQDHCLLACTWNWKVRTLDIPDRVDYSQLTTHNGKQCIGSTKLQHSIHPHPHGQ